MRRTIGAIAAVLLICVFSHNSLADEGMVPLAESGDWIAMAHHPSEIAPPDVCIAFDVSAGVALRADDNDIELRVTNTKWSLPAEVQGQVTVAVGDWKGSFDITDNTSNMVDAPIETPTLLAMLSAMDKAATMAITVGKAAPFQVSLIGSTSATNAFRTCANIPGSNPGGGENPFQ